MDETRIKQVIEFLNQKWKSGQLCGICGSSRWHINPKPLQLTEFNHGSFVVGGPVIPVVAITCMHCGNTHLFNALITGAVQREPSEAQKGTPSSVGQTTGGAAR
jgi:hypothetical protein